ncbi:hypothetical protein [Actinomadura rubrisoli]|uniref:Uncharacterized protein n=1 Tax=Actinomadura rubrisoli TaxID=2530368 RepID=A0A4V2YT89_9ACTN|nr:hypothetical protein [Actinomadura rubrisoli]TDD72867.1 hypothetical protein E1298_34645 [Actinomadura rubrisoli]
MWSRTASMIFIGLAVALIYYLVDSTTSSPSLIRVEFNKQGEACSGGLILDRDTGEEMSCCSSTSGFCGNDSHDEDAQILDLARNLASDGGLSGGDRAEIDRLAKKINADRGAHEFTNKDWVAFYSIPICGYIAFVLWFRRAWIWD